MRAYAPLASHACVSDVVTPASCVRNVVQRILYDVDVNVWRQSPLTAAYNATVMHYCYHTYYLLLRIYWLLLFSYF